MICADKQDHSSIGTDQNSRSEINLHLSETLCSGLVFAPSMIEVPSVVAEVFSVWYVRSDVHLTWFVFKLTNNNFVNYCTQNYKIWLFYVINVWFVDILIYSHPNLNPSSCNNSVMNLCNSMQSKHLRPVMQITKCDSENRTDRRCEATSLKITGGIIWGKYCYWP